MDSEKSAQEFLSALQESLKDGSFVKLTLGQYKGAEDSLKNIYVRKILIKQAEKLGFTYRYQTRDITKNFDLDEGVSKISEALNAGFAGATLMSTRFDLTLDKGRIKKAKPSHKEAPSAAHDRAKMRMIEPKSAGYLHALKITDAKGEVYKNAQDKFRQINKYVEIMSGLAQELGPDRLRKVVDVGAGKGYLTFALYDYLQAHGFTPEVIGVEYRVDLVTLCNDIAQDAGFSGLRFEQANAQDFDYSGANMVIALHACDTATDDAIAKGVAAGAEVIVVAPCCHKQVRREMEAGKARNDLDFVLKHGIYRERTAEMVTDGLRGLMLEYHGYAVKIFEFISSEHTAKNIMIVATKNKAAPEQEKLRQEIESVKAYFGIERHYLEQFLLK